MTALLSRDPGQQPGYVWLDGAGTVVRASHIAEDWVHNPPHGKWNIAVTERQWWYPGTEKDPNRLFQLAFDAGWSLRGVPALRYMRIPPKEWRGQTSANKAQVQKRIARNLTAQEKALFSSIPAARHGDIIDAIGIGRAALRNLSTTQFDWPGKGYGK